MRFGHPACKTVSILQGFGAEIKWRECAKPQCADAIGDECAAVSDDCRIGKEVCAGLGRSDEQRMERDAADAPARSLDPVRAVKEDGLAEIKPLCRGAVCGRVLHASLGKANADIRVIL